MARPAETFLRLANQPAVWTWFALIANSHGGTLRPEAQ